MKKEFENFVEKLQEKYDNGEVITEDDVKEWSVDDIVYALKEIGLIEWWCEHYGEPGYEDPEKEILFANWNMVENPITEKITENGYEIEWNDEWVQSEEGLAFRCVANDYGWTPSYYIKGGAIYSIKENEEDYINDILLNNPEKAAPSWFDLSKYGFSKVEESDSGWYEYCKNKPPQEIVEEKVDETEDFVFKIDAMGPWCTEFSLWTRPKIRFVGEDVELICSNTDDYGEVTQDWKVTGKIIDNEKGEEQDVYAIFNVIKQNEIIIDMACKDENFGSDYVDLLEDAENFLNKKI